MTSSEQSYIVICRPRDGGQDRYVGPATQAEAERWAAEMNSLVGNPAWQYAPVELSPLPEGSWS